MVKEKVGIKEAFIIPTESNEETNKLFDEIESDIDNFEVPLEYLSTVMLDESR